MSKRKCRDNAPTSALDITSCKGYVRINEDARAAGNKTIINSGDSKSIIQDICTVANIPNSLPNYVYTFQASFETAS
jgi:DNA transposition AAA+ family ATPase